MEISQSEETQTALSDDAVTIEDPSLTSPASTEKAKATNPRKRSKPVRGVKSASGSDSEAPFKKKPRKFAPAKGVPAGTKDSGESSEEEKEREKALATTKRKAVTSMKEVPQLDEPAEHQPLPKQGNTTLNLSRFAYGQHTRPAPPASPSSFIGPSNHVVFGTNTESQTPDHDSSNSDMEEHYSDVEIPTTLGIQTPTLARSSNTPRTRSKVSQRELSSLSQLHTALAHQHLRESHCQQRGCSSPNQMHSPPSHRA